MGFIKRMPILVDRHSGHACFRVHGGMSESGKRDLREKPADHRDQRDKEDDHAADNKTMPFLLRRREWRGMSGIDRGTSVPRISI